MKIRAELRIRNGAMILRRKKLGYSQILLAKVAGVPIQWLQRIEQLRYPDKYPEAKVNAVAEILQLEPEKIVPKELIGEKFSSKFIAFTDMAPRELAANMKQQYCLPGTSSVLGKEEIREKLKPILNTLTFREREIIKLRYGLGDGNVYTLEEVGRMFLVSGTRIRQIEAKAIRKLQYPVRQRALCSLLENPPNQKENQ